MVVTRTETNCSVDRTNISLTQEQHDVVMLSFHMQYISREKQACSQTSEITTGAEKMEVGKDTEKSILK